MTSQRWMAAGLALFSLGLMVGWSLLKKRRFNEALWANLEAHWPGYVARFSYFVGLPYFAILWGLLSTRLLGLKGLENFALVQWGTTGTQIAAEIRYAVVLMVVEWLSDGPATLSAGLITLAVLVGVKVGLAHQGVVLTGSLHQVSILDTIYNSLHWAFYWALFWLITDDLYLGVVLGTGFVILEWMLGNYWVKQDGRIPQQLWLRIIILILTATIFFYSPNLWVLWPIHLAMVWLINYSYRTGTVNGVARPV